MGASREIITFDPARHAYTDAQGRAIPGVTSVLKAVGLIDTTWYTPEAAQRGTSVHALTMLSDDDLIDHHTPVPAEYVKYLDAWVKFRTETDYEPMLVEHRIYHPTYRYAGTLDRAGKLNGQYAVLDIKTGKAMPATGIQLAAYQACIQPAHARFAVELHDDGTYKLIEYRDRNDWNVWLAALQVYQWRTLHHVNI